MSSEQIERIRMKICQVLDKKRAPLQEINDDIDPDYAKGRFEQEITKLVYNAFQPKNQDIEGVTIKKRKYGKDMTLPELLEGDAVYQVYNHTAEPYNTEEVKRRLDALGEYYHTLEFTITSDTYELSRIEMVSFDGFTETGRAKIKNRSILWPAA